MASVILGLLMDAFWLGVIFARISSPRPLRHTILFSEKAVIYTDSNGMQVFDCRMVNLRHRYPWIDLGITITLNTFEKGKLNMTNLQVFDDAEPFIDAPWHVRHHVLNGSLLQELLSTPGAFENRRGEIIIELNGQDPLTGNCMKKRFSYNANEICHNMEFVPILSTSKDGEGYVVDISKFHDIEPMPAIKAQVVASATGQKSAVDSYGATQHE